MNRRVCITGINYEVDCLEVGAAQIFDGAGDVIVSAIKCLQENRYRVYVICMEQVFDKTLYDLNGAAEYLQSIYNEKGRIF